METGATNNPCMPPIPPEQEYSENYEHLKITKDQDNVVGEALDAATNYGTSELATTVFSYLIKLHTMNTNYEQHRDNVIDMHKNPPKQVFGIGPISQYPRTMMPPVEGSNY